MFGLILTLHIIICAILVVIVLVQAGKGAGLGVFGGGSNENLFSAPSGSAFLKKFTVGLVIAFFCSTILLTLLQSRKSTRSVMERIPMQQGGQ